MRLTPKEQEKLMLHMAGNLAKERKERGVKLNYVESLAYISSELLELARDGKTVVELMQLGTKILTKKRCYGWCCRYAGRSTGRGNFSGWNQAGNGT